QTVTRSPGGGSGVVAFVSAAFPTSALAFGCWSMQNVPQRPSDPTPAPAAAGADPTSAPGAHSVPNPMALLKALRRPWLLALTLGLLAAGAAGAGVWFGMPVKYTVSCLLHVSSSEPRVLGAPGQSQNTFAIYQKTQAALVKSRPVLTSALKHDNL